MARMLDRRQVSSTQVVGAGVTFSAGVVPPPGYDWVTLNGQPITFTGTFNGVSYVNEPIYTRIV